MSHYLAFAGAVISLTVSMLIVAVLTAALVRGDADWWSALLGGTGLSGWLLMSHSRARIWVRDGVMKVDYHRPSIDRKKLRTKDFMEYAKGLGALADPITEPTP